MSKHVKMHRKPTGGTNKHGVQSIVQSKKREGYARSDQHHGDASQMVTSEQCLMGVGCYHTTTNPLKASSVAKPKTREANTSMKHEGKQAYTYK